MLARLKAWLIGPDSDDGIGLSLFDELKFLRRVRRQRGTPTVWRIPTEGEARDIAAHPLIGRFGDMTIAVADIDGRRWIVRDRDWSGWPDPPQFVAFAFEGDALWAAADFNDWPRRWSGVAP